MIVMVGIGNVGSELLAKLSRDFEITCLDNRPDAEEVVAGIRGKEKTKVIVGDATSRLVLEQARVDESDVVLITTSTEKINLEVARVLHDHFSPRRVISIGITDRGMKELAELGAEAVSIFTASANDVRNLIEHQAKTAHGIGIGKNEILEVEVHPNSRLKNRQLGSIAPIRWNVGIIYRDGNIVIPKPETVLKERDKVVVLGDPVVLKTVAELLSSEFERFPLEFGSSLGVYVTGSEEERFFDEVNYIYSVFQLDAVHFVYSARAKTLTARHDEIMRKYRFKETSKTVSSLAPPEALKALDISEGAKLGITVVSKKSFPSRGFSFSPAAEKFVLSSLLHAAKCPVVLAAGSFPYSKLLVPTLIDFDFGGALDKAIEISHTISAEVFAMTVKPSSYIGTEEESEKFEEMKKMISNVGFVHKKRLDLEILTGNPVLEISRRLGGYNLLLLGGESWSANGFLRSLLSPDVAWQILRRSPISTLILPAVEELL